MFQEQVTAIGHCFSEWTEAEQMVLLYSLLKKLTPIQLKLLSRIVDQHMSECVEMQMLEQQANNPTVVTSILNKNKDLAMQQMLALLPLLRPGNFEAKARFLSAIPSLLTYSVETGENLSEAKQLISYSLIHPAILSEDRKQLTPWVQILKSRFINPSASSQVSSSEPPTATASSVTIASASAPLHPQLHLQNWRPREAARVRRSNSLTPPVSLCCSAVELWTGQEELTTKQKPRSFSLSSEHVPPLSPQSSQASSGSGSETQLDESKNYSSEFPGMKDVQIWLKLLRLHKYIWLFSQLNYEEMMALTEEKLESLGVTKGARHKIILSVRKLNERYITLMQLDKDVTRGANLMAVLEELKFIVCSPMKPTTVATNETVSKTDHDSEDLQSQVVKVLGKVSTHLIVNNVREEDTLRLSMWLLERCLANETFHAHRKRLDTWRIQLHTLWQQSHQRPSKWYQQHVQHSVLADSARCLRRGGTSSSPATNTSSYNNRPVYFTNSSVPGNHLAPPFPVMAAASTPNPALDLANSSIMMPPPAKYNHNNITLGHFTSVSPTKLVITDQQEKTGAAAFNKSQETDINSKLEDLCLSMAEHFLEGVS